MSSESFTIRATGDWGPSQVTTRWVPSTRIIHPDVDAAIAAAWRLASSRKDIHLFDGPMCRLEQWSATPSSLDLGLSPTSYRIFLGTNLHNATLADRYGAEVLANPVGLSTVIQSGDDFLLLGRRSSKVAYYPDRIHPFAGALEPCENIDIFAEARRELVEELSMGPGQIEALRCIGLVEDRSLRQPELIFLARSNRAREQIESKLDPTEHRAIWALPAKRQAVADAVRDPALTSVAAAGLMLWLNGSHLPSS